MIYDSFMGIWLCVLQLNIVTELVPNTLDHYNPLFSILRLRISQS